MPDEGLHRPFVGTGFPDTSSSGPFASFLPQVYPGQQYLPGGQYTPGATQYAPGPGQPPAPSSYPGHRLPLQQGTSPSLSTASPAGPHFKVGPAPPGLCGPCWPCAQLCGTQTDLEAARAGWGVGPGVLRRQAATSFTGVPTSVGQLPGQACRCERSLCERYGIGIIRQVPSHFRAKCPHFLCLLPSSPARGQARGVRRGLSGRDAAGEGRGDVSTYVLSASVASL